jgi:SAM-dependent methyltransferase
MSPETQEERVAAGPCPACGTTERSFAFSAHDWYLEASAGRWSYFRCASCASVLADPQPSDGELDAAYAASYGPYSDRPGLIERLAEPLARREAAALARLADATGPLVDVGCGAGAMLRRLGEVGWSGPMLGIEPDAEVAARVASKLGVPVRVASVEELPAEVDGASLIVLRHVIEHVREPRAVLGRIHGALRPGGLIYVGTPDRRALAETVFGRHWHGYDPPRHLYAFTRGAVRSMLDQAGFDVIHERWDYAPQMWAGSLQHRLTDSRFRRLVPAASLMNPLVAAPSILAGAIEWLARRTTMYGAVARKRTGP